MFALNGIAVMLHEGSFDIEIILFHENGVYGKEVFSPLFKSFFHQLSKSVTNCTLRLCNVTAWKVLEG